MKRPQLPFWLITLSIAFALTLPWLIRDGMFMDGELYTCVSHNLSEGRGTFWFPVFSASYNNFGSPYFLEHPPLVFGIQSLFFRLLGNSMYVERIYIFLTMCISIYLLALLYRQVTRGNASWLPVLLWFLMPTTFWMYHNNMMENTMGIFTLAAVILIFRGMEKEKRGIMLILTGGILIFLVSFSKGIPGLFPVVIPLVHWLCFKKQKLSKSFVFTLLLIAVPVIIYALLMCFDQPRESLSFYFTKRLLGRIHDDPTVSNRFHIMKLLFNDLIIPSIVVAPFLVINAIKGHFSSASIFNRRFFFFLLTGIAASFPLVITRVQSGFYNAPSLPYYAAALSCLIAPQILRLTSGVDNRKYRSLLVLGTIMLILVLSVTASLKGKASRDRELLHDVYTIGRIVPKHAELQVTDDLKKWYVLECYFIRYFNISTFAHRSTVYYLKRKDDLTPVPVGYEKIKADTEILDIYKKSIVAQATSGGISLYITGVTSRANRVEVMRPPMITQARGE